MSSITQIAKPSVATAEVSLEGDTLHISLTVTHPEAAALARKHQAAHGDASLADLCRTALPIGIVALSLGGVGMDQSSIMRTFADFEAQVGAASTAALDQLAMTTTALRVGEQDLAARAARVLDRLPEHVTKALAGASADVRIQVQSATAEVQAAGLRDIRAALDAHAEIVRTAVSLDTKEGPIRALREEVLRMVESSRRELGGQLNAVQGLLMAAQAAAAATACAKPTRSVGQQFEAEAMQTAFEVVSAAGDLMDFTGSVPAPGSTSRAGDGVATLSTLISGQGRSVRIVLEAKILSRPLTSVKWRAELTASRDLRAASGGLAIVPAGQVPGGQDLLFSRVGERLFVVCADPQIVSLVYLVLRELCALASGEHSEADNVDLAVAEARISQALTILGDLDLVTRHANAASTSLEKIREAAADIKTRAGSSLRDSLKALHSNT